MTWLGKILAVVAMLLALVWMWFTVSVFVARTNWKTQADAYKTAFNDAKTARDTEYQTYLAEKDALNRQLAAEKSRSEGLVGQVKSLQGANDTTNAKLAQLTKLYTEADIQAKLLASNQQATLDELNKARERVNALEDDRVRLTIAREEAAKRELAAVNALKQAEATTAQTLARLDRVTADLSDLRAQGRGGPGGAAASPLDRNPPAPVREGTRGTVTRVQDGFLVVNIGIDAGLAVGSVLDVYRSEGGGAYLGTVKINAVYPKEAVGTFQPADPTRTIRNLRPEQLPKTGDTVGKVGGGVAAR